ncbi:MAG: SGNH/GDSL hydrolase family protein [Phycisphaerales bacterium]|nr:MAG: SGNH/GDSL hydrolase family protein [Phycisphaerales bacterium]
MTRSLTRKLTLFCILLSISLLGCQTGPESRSVPAPPPKVLIIGDSISIGYFEPTKALLCGTADVIHNPGNAQHTAYGLDQLNEWVGETRWDVIHFNHGLHDLKYADEQGKLVAVDEGKQQIPIDEYACNLEELTVRLKKTDAALIFATTTPIPERAHGRVKGDEVYYNNVARAIMTKHGVAINDLYSFALGRLDTIQQPRNVHFTEEGSRQLGRQVAMHILAALEQ